MLRRLFFLFPRVEHAQCVVDQLQARGIHRRQIHAISHGIDTGALPEATERQKNDTTFLIERFLWAANLGVFALATSAFLISLVASALWPGILFLLLMMASFIVGEQFVVRIPDVHLNEFTDALQHGEILLMIDVPLSRVAEIEGFIHHRHPEAVTGGVGWSIDAFGI